MRGFVVSTALLNRITDPDARRRLEEAKLEAPRPEPSFIPQTAHVDPIDRYRIPRKFVGWRHITAGCASCRQAEPRWLQRQIETPERCKRLILWFADLLPRATGLGIALMRGLADRDRYDKRQARCDPCPHRVIHLQLLEGIMREKSYCGRCPCPTWWLARLDIKNWLLGWLCPEALHGDSDPDAAYRVYVLGKVADAQRTIMDGGGGMEVQSR